MADRENVITHLQIIHTWAEFARERDLQFFTAKHLEDIAQWADEALELLKEQSQIVRCKDCKHRPKKPDWETYEDGADIEFPDGKCPCQCSSDRYYSWYPDDDWFCADGER